MKQSDLVWSIVTIGLMTIAGIYGHQQGYRQAEAWYISTPNERGYIGCVNGSVLVKNITIEFSSLTDHTPIIRIPDNPCGPSSE